ncbi:MAG: hypothetical protein BMS9Abin29_1016 [Gemmatimonadota bacterium]|nr:MAG: hypothetical protein BMS9Abin29_1016 [Gemmatimonadota bacterium]
MRICLTLSLMLLAAGCWSIVDIEGRSISRIRLRGTVVNRLTEEPVEGVRVGVAYLICFGFSCDTSRPYSDATGPNGAYEFEHEFVASRRCEDGLIKSGFPMDLMALVDSLPEYRFVAAQAVQCSEEPQVFDFEEFNTGRVRLGQ